MCYSAQIWADYRKYLKTFGADLDIKSFVELYWARQNGAKVKTPKAMDDSFREGELGELIQAYRKGQASKLEQELLAQLSADMPAMLEDRNTFFREFEDRACQILAVTAPEDEAYVQEVLDAYVERSRVNE
jgi:hypothetical protein